MVEDHPDSKYYRREGDKLSVGKAEVKEITYGFYKNRFSYLNLKVHGFGNWSALKEAVFATYGKGNQPNEYIEEWYWGGSFPAGVKAVNMTLEYNEFAKEGVLTMSYKPISDERKAEEAKAAKEAKKDF